MGNAGNGNPAGPSIGATTGAAPAIGGVPAGIATAPGVFGRGGGAAATGQALSSGDYELHGIYFKPRSYASEADCLTAAYAKGIPLDVCR
jgi:hypothetical protein